MSADESVRDRVARTLEDAADALALDDYVEAADRVLAAFPEIGLFERLERFLDPDRCVRLTARPQPWAAIHVSWRGAEPGRGTRVESWRGVSGMSVAAALSALLDRAETTSPSDDPSAGALADAPLGAGTFGSGPAYGEQGSKGQPGGGGSAAGPTPTTNEEGRDDG